MWNIVDAIKLIQEMNTQVREYGYHIMIGGSVAYNGSSDKDLDLFFCPMNGNDGMRKELLAFLIEKFGWLYPIRDSPDYQTSNIWYWNDMLHTAPEVTKRIDFFIR